MLGRFDRLLFVGPPDENDREDIFRIHLRKIPCHSDVCIKELALLTKGCTGADISLICREAAIAAIEVCWIPYYCVNTDRYMYLENLTMNYFFVMSGKPWSLRNNNGALEGWHSKSTAL